MQQFQQSIVNNLFELWIAVVSPRLFRRVLIRRRLPLLNFLVNPLFCTENLRTIIIIHTDTCYDITTTLASVKSRMVYPSGTSLPRLSWKHTCTPMCSSPPIYRPSMKIWWRLALYILRSLCLRITNRMRNRFSKHISLVWECFVRF